MFTGLPVWIAFAVVLALVVLVTTIRQTPARALGAAMAVSFVFPVWIVQDWFDQPIGLRTLAAIIGLLAFCVHPKGSIRSPITLLDFCIGAMFIAHVWSDTLADGFSVGIPFRAYGEWVLPYVAGRFSIARTRDLRFLRPWMLSVLVILSLTAIGESLFSFNIWDAVFGEPPTSEINRDGQRFGFQRAYSMTLHPIFTAMLLLLMLPWTRMNDGEERDVEADDATDDQPSALWQTLPLILLIAGVAAGISRGPILGLGIAAVVAWVLNHRRFLWPSLAAAAILIVGAVIFPDAAVTVLEKFGGSHVRLVEVDGEVEEITGTRSRLLIYQAYGGPMLNAGLTGYGTIATNQFPPNIPYLESTRDSVEKLRLVDNAYVLLILRFGWLGLACFILLFLTALGTAIYLSSDPQIRRWCTVFAGCLVASLMVFFTVWMSYDFGFYLLWSVGLLSGLASARQKQS
ncbi:MAG: O-antigen ligase family protein [Planctomycetaceae bacterium]